MAHKLGGISFDDIINQDLQLGGGLKCSVAAATYQALQPSLDTIFFQAKSTGIQQHIFAGVIRDEVGYHGGQYCKRYLHKEILQQIKKSKQITFGEIKRALRKVYKQFQDTSPYGEQLFIGTSMRAVLIDSSKHMCYSISLGGCYAYLATSSDPAVDTDCYHKEVSEDFCLSSRIKFKLRAYEISPSLQGIIVGSQGLWNELSSYKASLCISSQQQYAPQFMEGNGAAAVIVAALQEVSSKMSKSGDIRYGCLSTLDKLIRLEGGSSRGIPGFKLPRRKRGDVHGDMSVVVLRFSFNSVTKDDLAMESQQLRADPPGIRKSNSLSSIFQNQRRRLSWRLEPVSPKAANHSHQQNFAGSTSGKWNIVRMYFLSYLPEYRKVIRQKWYRLYDAILPSSQAAVLPNSQTRLRQEQQKNALVAC